MDDAMLNAAAQVGDIDLLYTLIRKDPHVLEHMDAIPFVDTPLHHAASAGHLRFATEIMRLKPSFAWKLNQQGFSPIHLALVHGHERVVLRFVDINNDLVRVRGRDGLTPLHYVSHTGDIDLLAYFLRACPDSIEDVTVRSETALHVAVKNQQYEALQVLVGWLKRVGYGDDMNLEKSILNWKDDEGNTILHISVGLDDIQACGLLVKARVDLKAKNLENLTALDIAGSEEMKNKLVKGGALHGSAVTDAPTLAHELKSNTSAIDRIVIFTLRIRGNLSDEQRNCLLVVAALVATAAYQAALSPPGGADANLYWTNIFIFLTYLNELSFLTATVAIYILLPRSRIVNYLLFTPLSLFVFSYLYSMKTVDPTPAWFTLLLGVIFGVLVMGAYNGYLKVAKRLERYGQRKEVESMNRRGNRW